MTFNICIVGFRGVGERKKENKHISQNIDPFPKYKQLFIATHPKILPELTKESQSHKS